MKLSTALFGFAATAFAALNTTREYRLKTCLKPNSLAKQEFEGLYLASYHIGAGSSDPVFVPEATAGIRGYLGATNVTSSNGTKYYNQAFDQNNTFPWGLVMEENVNFYAAWEPVRIQAGASGSDFDVSGFFINETGLQWTSNTAQAGAYADAFGGWLVCNWWHGLPQLFFRIAYYDRYGFETPSSCADVFLEPVYL